MTGRRVAYEKITMARKGPERRGITETSSRRAIEKEALTEDMVQKAE